MNAHSSQSAATDSNWAYQLAKGKDQVEEEAAINVEEDGKQEEFEDDGQALNATFVSLQLMTNSWTHHTPSSPPSSWREWICSKFRFLHFLVHGIIIHKQYVFCPFLFCLNFILI
ncbi:unnamed protein product [Schistocephalus solidus]|uniref:Uncharacterized protein n=1 Tax=Schistocephalus solidus TaxID=70667 RepID=A0A183TQJ4_SCHSO|nr:unnamed protein product [Schistocephalus solidus]